MDHLRIEDTDGYNPSSASCKKGGPLKTAGRGTKIEERQENIGDNELGDSSQKHQNITPSLGWWIRPLLHQGCGLNISSSWGWLPTIRPSSNVPELKEMHLIITTCANERTHEAYFCSGRGARQAWRSALTTGIKARRETASSVCFLRVH